MMKNKILMLATLLLSTQLWAGGGGSPTCSGLGENYVGWPTNEPVWEMCYLSPADSSATQGSSLEIRQVYYNGYLVLERAHVPMLFANYASSTCYRDWKNTLSNFIQADQVENPTTPAITTCDASTDKVTPVGNCPFGMTGTCFSGVQVEKYPDRLVLTTNHSAAWYKYSSRYIFWADGRFQPRFGFGNSNGTNSGITHWHHAYWRLNFDIDGAENDEVFIVDDQGQSQQTIEFHDLREITSGQPNDPNVYTDEVTWLVKDSVTGRGYQMVPTFEGDSQQGFIDDYNIGPNPGMDDYHNVDVMVSNYKLFNNGTLPEYSDTPGSNSLGDCSMEEENIVNNESLVGVDGNPVFWYRTAVEDIQNQGMLCKTGGPTFYPVGDWDGSDAPVAVQDALTVIENTVDNVIDVLSNDTDTDGGPKYIVSVTSSSNGTVTIDSGGLQLLYTPTADYCNDGVTTDDFEYSLNGGSTAQVQMSVTCVDSLPTAVTDAVTVNQNDVDVIINVLDNDTDPDGGPQFVDSVIQPDNGTVVIGTDGAFVEYSPMMDYCNDGAPTDDFSYTLNGGSQADVNVSVTCLGPSDLIFENGFE